MLATVGRAAASTMAPATFLIGADVSALSTLERHGAVYRDSAGPRDALQILAGEGFNCYRLRLFVAPDGKGIVTNDLAYTLALARRVKAAGATLMLDLHYSDTWADPGKQFKPAAWAALAFDDLEQQVRTYTREVLERFAREGLMPDYVQLGNEITNGMLWPEGRVEFAERTNRAGWEHLGRLLRAAHVGLAEASEGRPKPKSVLHIESPHQRERTLWFCREARAAKVPFDLIGMSYYPEWHGDLETLRGTLVALATEFHQPIIVAETAYPWTSDEHWTGRPNLNWPLTPEGQRQFLRAVLQVVRELPDGLGRGVLYWHPESVLTPGQRIWLGGSCALFDHEGNVLPAARFAVPNQP
ncbi:glycoside hydrolase family 53 protein [Opitutus terrae]|nr:glycosyl hydrolase 53 family protein [Opitutus terrae]